VKPLIRVLGCYLVVFCLAWTRYSVFGVAADVQDKFALRAGIVLVFPRQDNASVGGAGTYRRGHVDNVEGLCGITDYVYFSEGWTNGCDRTFAAGEVAGLNCETEWASGLMHRNACLDLAVSKRCMMHLCRAAWYHLRHGNALHVLLPALIDQLAARENR